MGIPFVFARSFFKNVCQMTLNSVHYRVFADIEMTLEETPETIVKQQLFTRKGRVRCEVKSIGATGVQPPLPVRTTVCIGAKTGQPVQR